MLRRFRKILRMLCCICGLCLVWQAVPISFAQEKYCSSKELIEQSKQLDGTEVRYEGEVIGDIMNRGAYTWVNVHDGKNALGCWMPRRIADTIRYAGNFKTRGDWVVVSGQFHRACPMHGGDLDIHVQELTIARRGHDIIEPFNIAKRNVAVVLAGVLCLVLILMRFRRP